MNWVSTSYAARLTSLRSEVHGIGATEGIAADCVRAIGKFWGGFLAGATIGGAANAMETNGENGEKAGGDFQVALLPANLS